MKAPKSITPHAPQESTREALIESYLDLCSRMGAGKVTIEQIAQASGFSFGTVRYHFAGDNHDITQSAIVYVIQKATRFLQAQLTSARQKEDYDPIDAYITANFLWMEQSPTHSRFLFYYYYLCSTHVDLVLKNETFLKATRARLDELLIEGIGRGIYSRGRGIQGLSTQVHCIVVGACITSMAEGLTGPHCIHAQHAKQSVRAILKLQLAEN